MVGCSEMLEPIITREELEANKRYAYANFKAYNKERIMPDPIKIIAGFAGVGQSFYQAKNPECYDATQCYDTEAMAYLPKDAFFRSYLRHIIGAMQENKHRVIFVDMYEGLLERMTEYGLKFTVVYPHRDLKKEYIDRYRQRQDDTSFIKKISDDWNYWITFWDASTYKKCRLASGQFLSDVIEEI